MRATGLLLAHFQAKLPEKRLEPMSVPRLYKNDLQAANHSHSNPSHPDSRNHGLFWPNNFGISSWPSLWFEPVAYVRGTVLGSSMLANGAG